MRSLIQTGSIGVVNKFGVKYPIQFIKNQMMNQAITNSRLANNPVFRIPNMESNIRSVPISLILKLSVKFKNIIFQVPLKFQDIPLLLFLFPKFVPA